MKKGLFRCGFAVAFLISAAGVRPAAGAGVAFGKSSFDDVAGLPAIEQAMFEEVNRVREGMGLAPLEWDAGLTSAARQHSDEMKRLYYFSHDSPTPGLEDVLDRVYHAGLTDISVAENLASENSVPPSAEPATVGREVTALLMASEDHRANILDRRFTHSGIGCSASEEGTLFCTQLFSKRTVKFKFLKLSEKSEKTLKVSLTLKTEDVVGVWVDEKETYIFEPEDGDVTVDLFFRLNEGPRKVVLARRGVEDYGAMKGFFIGKFDPEKPINLGAGITEMEVISEEQAVGEQGYYILEAEGELLVDASGLKLADGNVRYGVDLKGKRFKTKYAIPKGSGRHEIFFLVGDETTQAVKIDADRPLNEAFGGDIRPEYAP